MSTPSNTFDPLPTTTVTRAAGSLSVVHVVLSLDVGGLERVVLDLVRSGISEGNAVTVVCLSSDGTLSKQATDAGARLVVLNKTPGIRPGIVFQLAKLFRTLRPDVVHTHQIGALFYTGPAARLARVSAVVHSEHGKHFTARRRMRILGRVAAWFAHRFVCVSTDIANDVSLHRITSPSKLSVISNGIELSRFQGQADQSLRQKLRIPADALVVGTIGRLTEIKRQDVLLRAFAKLHRSNGAAILLIVGDGPLRASLESLATELGIHDACRFAGYDPQPERCLPLMNIFALTSRSEGTPLVILEAWASSLPVIASAVGGLPELLGDGATGTAAGDAAGILFPAGDVDALAAALVALSTDREQAGRLARIGHARVRASHSLQKMTRDYDRLYRDVLQNNRKLSKPLTDGVATSVATSGA